MDEVLELCRRVLGIGPLAEQAAAQVAAGRHRGRVPRLGAAVAACRSLAGTAVSDGDVAPSPTRGELERAVAVELSSANARLPADQREVLVLRELFGLSHKEIARALHVQQPAVPPLLADARLQLYAARRGTDAVAGDCPERERTLRLLACRQDGEPMAAQDEEWLFEHIGQCTECATAHATMLEASVCYRAWRPSDMPAAVAPQPTQSEPESEAVAEPVESEAVAEPAASEPVPEPAASEPVPEPAESEPEPDPEPADEA